MADVVFGSHDNSTAFGSTVHYVCREDDDKPGKNSSYRCDFSGVWISSEFGSSLPSCSSNSGCGRPSRPLPPQVKRIVGGRSAGPGLFPWQVLLLVEDRSRVPEQRWFGSAAILSPSWILTAAHLLRSPRRDGSVAPVAPQHIQVFLGLHDAGDRRSATNRSVDRVLLHPDFQLSNYDNDVALLRLTEAVEFNELIRPVCLPPPHTEDGPPSPPPHSLGVVAGWGVSSVAAPPSSEGGVLRFVKLPVLPQADCRRSFLSRSAAYSVTDNMFCAGFSQGGRDSCLGDSGGAFVMEEGGRWVAFGLVSWGGPEDCGSRGAYGVYSRLPKHVSWIHEATAPPPL